jgi:hypothetical protein
MRDEGGVGAYDIDTEDAPRHAKEDQKCGDRNNREAHKVIKKARQTLSGMI